jgi:hypothetical protein
MLKALRLSCVAFFLLATTATFANQPQQDSYPSSALFFEINRGQTAPQVQYLARSREGSLFLTADGLTVAKTGQLSASV